MNLPQPDFYPDWREWARSLMQVLLAEQPKEVKLPAYAVADLPAAGRHKYTLVIVTDDQDGTVPAFSDGISWLRVTDLQEVAVAP